MGKYTSAQRRQHQLKLQDLSEFMQRTLVAGDGIVPLFVLHKLYTSDKQPRNFTMALEKAVSQPPNNFVVAGDKQRRYVANACLSASAVQKIAEASNSRINNILFSDVFNEQYRARLALLVRATSLHQATKVNTSAGVNYGFLTALAFLGCCFEMGVGSHELDANSLLKFLKRLYMWLGYTSSSALLRMPNAPTMDKALGIVFPSTHVSGIRPNSFLTTLLRLPGVPAALMLASTSGASAADEEEDDEEDQIPTPATEACDIADDDELWTVSEDDFDAENTSLSPMPAEDTESSPLALEHMQLNEEYAGAPIPAAFAPPAMQVDGGGVPIQVPRDCAGGATGGVQSEVPFNFELERELELNLGPCAPAAERVYEWFCFLVWSGRFHVPDWTDFYMDSLSVWNSLPAAQQRGIWADLLAAEESLRARHLFLRSRSWNPQSGYCRKAYEAAVGEWEMRSEAVHNDAILRLRLSEISEGKALTG
ncbi:hypothetical protein MKEN_01348000 [Mycena kentingensis (nom. inval.)]|nr:hypothetical protein MKEN_01348000 [Mycena kentingensis (nom. inval.)]